ncbi:MAG: heavy-metal-associated domain-containing protein [Acidaminococcaceae bacterium]|nr:heavy-metal-associated domain-containing protein [Acidaminococcaceae bacterium]
MQKTVFIEGMHCEHCIGAVTKALQALPGIADVAVSLEKNAAVISGTVLDDAVIKAAIEAVGFDVTDIQQ